MEVVDVEQATVSCLHKATASRSSVYKKKKKKKRRGRMERLKDTLKSKDDKITKLNASALDLKKKLRDVELENIILQHPRSRSCRMHQLGLSATLGTSGRTAVLQRKVSLLPSIRLIKEGDLTGLPQKLGAGRFGTCYSQYLVHFKVCVKVFKHTDAHSFCIEANLVSKFISVNLPFLFGVLKGDSRQAIITSSHCYKDRSITLHYALSSQSKEVLANCAIEWKLIIQHILEGMEQLHVKYKVLHNDLKSDNIVIAPNGVTTLFRAVIVDFGKACDVTHGKFYSLSLKEHEQYKLDHPQIAPDLRDGCCKQTEASDIYSFGRIVGRINSVKKIQGWPLIEDLIKQCMMYSCTVRPCMSSIKEMLK